MQKTLALSFNEVVQEPRPFASLQEAMEIFDALADRKNIAFGFLDDGCYSRMHLMCSAIRKKGFVAKRAAASKTKKDWLYVQKTDGNRQEWKYHVAAAVAVQMPDGRVEDMVFDPGIFDGPVPLEEWGKVLHASTDNKYLHIETLDQKPRKPDSNYYGLYEDAYEDKIAGDQMAQYVRRQPRQLRIVFASNARQEAINHGLIAPHWQGETWVSIPYETLPAVPASQLPEKSRGIVQRLLHR